MWGDAPGMGLCARQVETVSGGLPRVPPAEIAAAAIGFLVYKFPLLYESSRQARSTPTSPPLPSSLCLFVAHYRTARAWFG